MTKILSFQLLMIFISWWSSEPLMTSASSEQLLRRCFWWRQLLQNLFSSDASLQYKLPFCRYHCSHLFFGTYTFQDTEFLSMVLHTWTNISISNWHFFLIPYYYQNLKGNVKHILFQQHKRVFFFILQNKTQIKM